MTGISKETRAAARAESRARRETIERLYELHRAQIARFCMRELGCREDADDATQLTFLNAFRGLSRGFVPEYESAWLFQIARNVCLNSRRSAFRRRRVELPSHLEGVDETLHSVAEEAPDLFGLKEVLLALPALQRGAILRREWQGMSYREIACELGVSDAAVESAIFRARRTIAEALEEPSVKRRRAGGLLPDGGHDPPNGTV